MKLASRDGNRWLDEQFFRWFRLRKRLGQFLRYRKGESKSVLFIVGCQRSGTSMIHHLFRLDWDAVTYDEWSPLSVLEGDEPLRWKPLEVVQEKVNADRSPFVVCKPLVESQNLGRLLDGFPGSKAIWMYRDYRDVVSSSLKYFGGDVGYTDLVPIIEGHPSNWRSENLAEADRRTILDLHHADLPAHDAAALFWYARNSLFWSREYAGDPRVTLCRYGDLVTDPSRVLRSGYDFLGRKYPGDRIVADVFRGSKGKGRHVDLTPAVDTLCRDMLQRLDAQPRLGNGSA